MFFTPQQKCNNISDFRLGAFLSAFGEHNVQCFTVERWTDLVPYCRGSPWQQSMQQSMRRPSRAIDLLRGIPSCTHCAYTLYSHMCYVR